MKKSLTLLIKKFSKLIYYLGNHFKINTKAATIICYHSISTSSDKYSTSLSDFKKQIEKISRNSQFLSAKDIENIVNGKRLQKSLGVCLTFDDGYKDLEDIISTISEYKIPPTIFVLGYPQKAIRSELANNHKLLSDSKIKKLHSLGWTIGYHTATHANLAKLDNKRLEQEIIHSKVALEKRLGFKINYFAYPKGVFNKNILKFVKKAGYKLAFSTLDGNVDKKTNPLIVPRTVVDKSKTLDDFPIFYSRSSIFLRTLVSYFKLGTFISKLQGTN